MIKCKPEERITSSNALQHLFLEPSAELLIPSLADMMLLPTTTLLMDNVYLQHGEDLNFLLIQLDPVNRNTEQNVGLREG